MREARAPMSADGVTELAAEVIHRHIDPQGALTDGIGVRCAGAARALADAGCFANPEHDRQVAARALRRAVAEAQVVHDSVPGCGEWGDFAEWLSDFAASIERGE